MLSEYQKLTDEIEKISVQLNDLPDGKLLLCRHKGRCKWYQTDGHTRKYISKKNLPLARKLALKKYLILQLKDLRAEQRAIRFYLDHHPNHPERASQLLKPDSDYHELLSPYFTPSFETSTEWMKAPFQQNSSHPEHLIHKSISGNMVRSKSEAIIDTFLYFNKIPYRYECALELKGCTIYPDFTILHPETGQIFYWEHFGLMNDSSYTQKAFSKLQLYVSNGILPSIDLITTYESKDHPLDTELVQKIISHYFTKK